MEELIKPNWHVALVHFPIALLGLGALLELLSFLGWRRSSVRLGARWMILAGALLAVPATFSGLYALHEEAPQGIAVLAEADPVLARQLTYHVWTQAAATVAAMLVVTLWIGLSDGLRDRLSVFFKLVLLGTVGVMAYGSHLGGQQVYEHGFAVHPTTAPATLPTAGELRSIDTWATLFPPDQLHVTVAGFAMAAACVCLGLSARGTHFDEMTEVEQRLQIASAFARQDTLPIEGDAYKPYVSHINHTPSVRAGRLWTLAWVTLLAASISGLLIIALDENVFRPSPFSFSAAAQSLWEAISKPMGDDDPALTRRLAHAIVGTVIVVDSLILALLSRFARRRATVLAVFALPLVLALAAQVWLGVLLLFDTAQGPATRFIH